MNGKIRQLILLAGFSDEYLDDLYVDDDLKIAQTRLVELVVKECVDRIALEMESFVNGDGFLGRDGEEIWESVTTEYGKVSSREYDPIGISHHISNTIKNHFGAE